MNPGPEEHVLPEGASPYLSGHQHTQKIVVGLTVGPHAGPSRDGPGHVPLRLLCLLTYCRQRSPRVTVITTRAGSILGDLLSRRSYAPCSFLFSYLSLIFGCPGSSFLCVLSFLVAGLGILTGWLLLLQRMDTGAQDPVPSSTSGA